MKYNNDIAVEDFVADVQFQEWVLSNQQTHKVYWNNWLKTYPHHKAMMMEATDMVQQLQFKPKQLPSAVIEEEWQRLQQKISKQESSPIIRRLQFLKYAAAVILCLFIGTGIWFWNQNEVITIATGYGEQEAVKLPDGSEVMLNSNSTLSYKEEVEAAKIREVKLEGEAFFDVRHSSERPFIVKGDAFDVNVLGTTFNVINRENKHRVVLNTGSVQVNFLEGTHIKTQDKSKVEKKITLKPNEWLESTKEGYIQASVNSRTYSSWTQNILTFDETPLSELSRILEDNYGLEVIIEDKSLSTNKITGQIPTENITDLLNAIQKAFDIKIIQLDRNTIKIRAEN